MKQRRPGNKITARVVPAVAVVAGLAVAGGLAVGLKPAKPLPAALTVRRAPVSRTVQACPPDNSRIAVFSASPLTSQGAATITPLSQTTPTATISTPRSLALVDAQESRHQPQAWSVTATGSMAPGLAAELANTDGLSLASCAIPGSDIWFVGPGQQNGVSHIQLHLMNVDVLTATVALTVITDAGPVQSAAYSGITVAPHQLVTETLDSATSGAGVVAIEVRTTSGRVAAAIQEAASHGPASWLPSSAAPATAQVIPGVPPSADPSGLLLVVPGSQNARVSLAAITAQGRYQPLGSQQIDLPGQSASFVQLPALGGSAVGLALSSNVPVTASVLVPGSGVGTFTVPVMPVTEQAVIAGNLSSGGLTATLSLTAPGAAARVSVLAGTQTQTLTIPAGRTLNVPLVRSRKAYSVTITPLPGSGPVYAARFETQGHTTTSIIAALTAPTMITLPPARESYAAISP